MSDLLFILGQSSNEEGGGWKVLIGIIFFLIYVVAQIAGSLAEARRKRRTEHSELEPVEEVLAEQPPPLPTDSERMTIEMQMEQTRQAELAELERQRQLELERRRAVELERRRQSVPPPPPGSQTRPPGRRREAVEPDRKFPQSRRPLPQRPLSPHERMTPGEIPISTAALARPAVSAKKIAELLRPKNLRQQYIITEILSPPSGLRPPQG